MHLHWLAYLLVLALLSMAHADNVRLVHSHDTGIALRSVSECEELSTTFNSGNISSGLSSDTSFVAISPAGSYSTNSDGLQLFLTRPNGKITTKGSINDKVATGATINSTFTFLYGRVTFYFSGPTVPGIVTAAILVGDSHDEIDIEILGGDPKHWQTNIFAPSPHNNGTIYGAFSGVEKYASGTVDDIHAYTIDWSSTRIAWSVDGREVRSLASEDTMKNGARHFPAKPMRIQLGIWDASSPEGTSEWARGPVDWNTAPHKMSAVFQNITVDCPYVRNRNRA
ncbi:glycoside hydrolase family 16 protein [Gelatoporia subvermispora B]|uniref:Glycoside hydrolase family 16 protein n=1 Tax=Ceriporiopsis subvermispora (strain B) TaxID=914234 RepID=M2RIW8_CERS8|nr:glycoside hydrolase family 16 protein [Gelatoporia subvermispora B]